MSKVSKKGWYNVIIHYPYGDSYLVHRKRKAWRFNTAVQHALDISRTWAVQYRITVEFDENLGV